MLGSAGTRHTSSPSSVLQFTVTPPLALPGCIATLATPQGAGGWVPRASRGDPWPDGVVAACRTPSGAAAWSRPARPRPGPFMSVARRSARAVTPAACCLSRATSFSRGHAAGRASSDSAVVLPGDLCGLRRARGLLHCLHGNGKDS